MLERRRAMSRGSESTSTSPLPRMFSATFYPITVYPTVLEWIVRCLPLYQGIELVRALTTGAVGPLQLVNVAYLVAMGLVGLAISARRIDKLLLK